MTVRKIANALVLFVLCTPVSAATIYGGSDQWEINYHTLPDYTGQLRNPIQINAIRGVNGYTNEEPIRIEIGYGNDSHTFQLDDMDITIEPGLLGFVDIDGERITDFKRIELPVAFDANWDFLYNFADISPYILALTDPTEYLLQDRMQWSLNAVCGSGSCGFHNLTKFTDTIINAISYSGPPGPPATSVPECSTWVSAASVLVCCYAFFRWTE